MLIAVEVIYAVSIEHLIHFIQFGIFGKFF